MSDGIGVRVTPETFIRAETDRYFWDISRQAGGVNRLFHFRQPTQLDHQTVVRMNRDTLYSMGVVDTSGGATITVPRVPAGRYASVYLADNDHYVPFVLYDAGTHRLPEDTRYVAVGVRIQLFDPSDAAEIASVNELQDQFTIAATSAEPFAEPRWDRGSLDALRAAYEREFATVDRYPDGWQGPRGQVDERTRHLAAAGAWGLFPNADALYINYNGRHPADRCHVATYDQPENDAFWSITVYGPDGYMTHERNVVSSATAVPGPDGRVTVHFGPSRACGEVANRVDVADGWNFLMRVYRPGPSVLDGSYRLPDVVPV